MWSHLWARAPISRSLCLSCWICWPLLPRAASISRFFSISCFVFDWFPNLQTSCSSLSLSMSCWESSLWRSSAVPAFLFVWSHVCVWRGELQPSVAAPFHSVPLPLAPPRSYWSPAAVFFPAAGTSSKPFIWGTEPPPWDFCLPGRAAPWWPCGPGPYRSTPHGAWLESNIIWWAALFFLWANVFKSYWLNGDALLDLWVADCRS